MLLDDGDMNTSGQGKLAINNAQSAVLFSADALEHCDHNLIPQYGLLGSLSPNKDSDSVKAADRRIFLNTNIPFSVFICGLQGSGKSHTTGCLIGNRARPLLFTSDVLTGYRKLPSPISDTRTSSEAPFRLGLSLQRMGVPVEFQAE